MSSIKVKGITTSDITHTGNAGVGSTTQATNHTTGVNQSLQTTGINTNVTPSQYQQNSINAVYNGTPMTELGYIINDQSKRIEELEKLVELLLAEVLPERVI